MVDRPGPCSDAIKDGTKRVDELLPARNAQELFDLLRLWHSRVVPGSASGLAGFIRGYCEAIDLPYGSFGQDMTRYVREFLSVEGVEWYFLIERVVRHQRSQIPIAYAAADYARQTIYRSPSSCVLPEASRTAWSDQQHDVKGADMLPAPTKVVVAYGNPGFWYLFFLDEKGVRFHEILSSTREYLVDHANISLRLDPASWVVEEPGFFNNQPGEPSCR